MHEYITCPHRVALVILFIYMCPHLLHFTLFPPLLTSPLSLPASSPFPTFYPFPFSLPIPSPSLSPLSPSVSVLSSLWLVELVLVFRFGPNRYRTVRGSTRFDVRFEYLSNLSNISLKIHYQRREFIMMIGFVVLAVCTSTCSQVYVRTVR